MIARAHVRSKFLFAASLGVMAAALAGLPANPAAAQECGTDYTIKDGDTLGSIAARTYGSPNQWTIIFYANQDRIGQDGTLLVPGLALRLPCIGRSLQARRPAAPAAPAAGATTTPPADTTQTAGQTPATPPGGATQGILISSMLRRLELLTADGYPPFTGRALQNGGMITHLIDTSLNLIKGEAQGRFNYSISWVNDWAAHLSPLLITRAFDVGFPYTRPDCQNTATLDRVGQLKCRRFFFSDPLYEVATLLYVRNDSNIRGFDRNQMQGITICRPSGRSIHEFDSNGRNWLRDQVVILVRPPSFDACFQMLSNGEVDSVAVSELAARPSIDAAGLDDLVRPLDTPLSFSTLHVVVTKTHPHARTILYYMNESLRRLRDSREYDQIVEKHLNSFWTAQEQRPDPSLASRAVTGGQTPPASAAAAATTPPAQPGTEQPGATPSAATVTPATGSER